MNYNYKSKTIVNGWMKSMKLQLGNGALFYLKLIHHVVRSDGSLLEENIVVQNKRNAERVLRFSPLDPHVMVLSLGIEPRFRHYH